MRCTARIVAVAVALLLLLAFGLQLRTLLRPDRGITLAAFLQIREGMTVDEVERILGCPPGNYAPEFDARGKLVHLDGNSTQLRWATRGYRVRVLFQQGRVCGKVDERTHHKETLAERLWDSLSWVRE